MRVQVRNTKSDRFGDIGTVEQKYWRSEALLIPVRIGRDECLMYRWNLMEL